MSSRSAVGGSGATIEFVGDVVVKTGPGAVGRRCGTQGAWIVDHPDIQALPRVHAVWSHGYVMETLAPIHWNGVTYADQVEQTVAVLQEQFWSQPAEVDIDPDAHLRFVQARCEQAAPDLWEPLNEWAQHLVWPTGGCLIHGDPTFANQCRAGQSLVLIDPNPATRDTPSLRAMDLANIAQSLHGYEAVKFRRRRPAIGPGFLRDLLKLDDDEWDLVRFLTATKFVRLLAYETDLRTTFHELAAELVEAR